MKNWKKIQALLLALTMLFCAVAMTACGGEAEYQVKVVDAQGNPYTSGVIVKFMQAGKQAGMQPVGADGIAKKMLTKGDYSVELVFTDDELTGHFDKEKAVLSAKVTSIEIVLMSGISGEGTSLFVGADEVKEYTAYDVTVGSTYIPVKANDRNYFLFTPTEAGTYQFSVVSSFR